MVVVDSSALIPLAWVGQLDLISCTFDDIRTAKAVRDEVLIEGKRGTVVLDDFLADTAIHEAPDTADDVAAMEGITVADGSVLLLAKTHDEILLANDRGLAELGRSHGVESWWVTTLLLKCTKDGTVTVDEATEILYDLVNAGMNLHPKVYSQMQNKLEELGN